MGVLKRSTTCRDSNSGNANFSNFLHDAGSLAPVAADHGKMAVVASQTWLGGVPHGSSRGALGMQRPVPNATSLVGTPQSSVPLELGLSEVWEPPPGATPP